MDRSAGILMHISSLPSKFGIGTLGECSFKFVRNLKQCGLKWWQMLPIGPVDEFGSPYQSFSTFAANSYLIDLDWLYQKGLLKKADYDSLNWGDDESKLDLEKVKKNKTLILNLAFNNYNKLKLNSELDQFIYENEWVLDYALFMVLLKQFEGYAWWDWPDEFKNRNETILNKVKHDYKSEIYQIVFEQLVFFKQWFELKQFANENGVKLIGDIPIYVAGNSADVWVRPENFCLDENRVPKLVSGCPPDKFAKDGQLWGHPIYDWNKLKQNNFNWWVKRFKFICNMFDLVRIDHFRGFESFFVIDRKETTARNGRWEKGPGFELFKQLESEIGKLNLIAEDLGFITPEVEQLLKQTGFPGMKILQTGFDSLNDNPHLPHNYCRNSVCYTGTHDNSTIEGWFKTLDNDVQNKCRAYLNYYDEPISWAFVRAAISSVSRLAIIPMQDFLALDERSRMNIPGTKNNNWRWRLTFEQEDRFCKLKFEIETLLKLFGRI